jgi:hypothetical protein
LLNLGLFHVWKIQKLKNIFAKEKKVDPNIRDFLNYTASFDVAKLVFKTRKKRISKPLQRLKRLDKNWKKIWTSTKKMTLAEYWKNKIEISFQQEKVNNKQDYEDVNYLLYKKDTQQLEETPKCLLLPPRNDIFKQNPTIKAINRLSIFKASTPTTSCSKSLGYNFGHFMTEMHKKMAETRAYKEQIRLKLKKHLQMIKKEDDSWSVFIETLYTKSECYQVSKRDKIEIVKECFKNQILEILESNTRCDDIFINFEHFSKVNMTQCAITSARELDRSIDDIKKRKTVNKLSEIDNQLFDKNKAFTSDIDEKSLYELYHSFVRNI